MQTINEKETMDLKESSGEFMESCGGSKVK